MSDPTDRLSAALSDRYRIERELGQGGMATVYLAEDLKHHRKVAIKVLNPDLAAMVGGERFLQEIETTAQLQHPHILPLFDSGRAVVPPLRGAERGTGGEAFLYYVMPYVEGETLREKLNREQQLGIDEAVKITVEVADALQYAHEQGVIHRDIKPENILLHAGRPMVADFGIALALSAAAGGRMTETGMSLGTPHYMSPEQATAEKHITNRSDIYALGCVLYEMLAGHPPHVGDSAQQVVLRIISEPVPAVTTMRHNVPPNVAAALAKALEQLPADRFETAKAFAAALSDPHFTTSAGTPTVSRADAGPWRVVSAVLALFVIASLGLALHYRSGATARTGPSLYDAALPDSAPMTFAATAAANVYGTPLRNVSLARSGSFAIYTALAGDSTMLWYRSLRDAAAHPIAGTVGATAPRISPDDSQVAYYVGGAVWIAPVSGGTPRKLYQGGTGVSLDWISADTLMDLDAAGGTFVLLDPESGVIGQRALIHRCSMGRWVPEVRELLCDVNFMGYFWDPTGGGPGRIRLAAPAGQPRPPLLGTAFRVVDGRYLLFIGPDGDLRGAPFDPKTALAGRSVPLVSGIRREGQGAGHYDIASDGTLLYAPGSDATVGRLVRLAPRGHAVPLPVPPATFQRFDLSPDGRWLAAVVLARTGQELRLYDLRQGQHQTWLTADDFVGAPLWSPSGTSLIVGARDSSRWAVVRGMLEGGGFPDTLMAGDSTQPSVDAMDWPAANHVILKRARVEAYTLIAGGLKGPFRPVLDSDVAFAAVSPDGRHLVYQTPETGRVMVTSFPTAGRRWQVASQGVEPLWLSATQLLYRLGVAWYVVPIDPATGEPTGQAKLWGRDPRFSDTPGWSNRPSRDGGIIYIQGPAETTVGYLRVIPNWVAQMQAAVDEANR